MIFKQLIPLTILLLVSGCQDDYKDDGSSCGDLSSYSYEFDITNISLEVLIAQEEKSYASLLFGEIYQANSDIIYSDIVFSLDSETKFVAIDSQKTKDKGQHQKINFTLISSAHACSLIPPSTNEKIVDIKITSSYAFNSSIAAGESLKSKFKVVFAESQTPFYQYQDGIIEYFSLTQYLEQEEVYAGNIMQLKLIESPEFAGSHIFFIEFTLDTGEVFLLETPEISFTKA